MSEPAWRVDSHVHLWDAIRDPEALRLMPEVLHGSFGHATLERQLVGTPTGGVVLIEAGSGLDSLARLRADAAASERILGFVAYADPQDPSLNRWLDAMVGDPKLVGVRFRFEGVAGADIDAPRILAAARAVVARDLALELLVTVEHLPMVRRLANVLPDLRGIVDHMAKPDIRLGTDRAAWSTEIRALGAETSLAMKVSVSPRADDLRWLADRGYGWTPAEVRPYLLHCLEAFGPDRVAWGSDWPVAALGGEYGPAADVVPESLDRLAPDDAERIFAGTARRVYRIGA